MKSLIINSTYKDNFRLHWIYPYTLHFGDYTLHFGDYMLYSQRATRTSW